MANETKEFNTRDVLRLTSGLRNKTSLKFIERTCCGHEDWSYTEEWVIQDTSDGSYWSADIEFPATEEQELEREEFIEFTRVYPKQKTIMAYEVEP